MVVDRDQPKKVVNRETIDRNTLIDFSLELVKFQTKENGPIWGCRVFYSGDLDKYRSEISDLFDSPDEAVAIGRVMLAAQVTRHQVATSTQGILF